MAITKCKQTKDNIIRMAQAAFPERFEQNPDCAARETSASLQIEELTEGMCNVAYKLTFADGFQTILKIASPIKSGFLSNERFLMEAEVRALKLVAAKTDVKVPEVYAYDTSKTVCEGDYFFMECMEGVNWITVYDDLTEETRTSLRRQIGEVQRELMAVTNPTFGMLGDDEYSFNSLFEFVYFMMKNVLKDAAARDIEIGVPAAEILTALAMDKACFDEVTTPSLVHWDMWEGNIFVRDGKVTGIIDWERTMWGEPFMDEPFRYHKRSPQTLEGFGISLEDLSQAEKCRLRWYDIFLYLTMMTEVFYREYEDKGQYNWPKGLFDEVWKKQM